MNVPVEFRVCYLSRRDHGVRRVRRSEPRLERSEVDRPMLDGKSEVESPVGKFDIKDFLWVVVLVKLVDVLSTLSLVLLSCRLPLFILKGSTV